MCSWYKDLHRSDLLADAEASEQRPAPSGTERGAGCFFDGGIDSFYTALKHLAELSGLLFVPGFASAQSDFALHQTVATTLRQAASDLGKPLIIVETNMRDLLDAYTRWDEQSRGAALASVALALTPRFQRMYIAAPFPYEHLFSCGSHPLLDPSWSTGQMEIVHDGCELDRWEKLERISTQATVQGGLRPCRHGDGAAHNCGQCPDCLRATAWLHTLGVQDKFGGLNLPIDLAALAQIDVTDNGERLQTEMLYDAITAKRTAPEVAQALRTCLKLTAEYDTRKQKEQELRQADEHIMNLHTQIRAIRASRSWRYTAPLRAAGALLKRRKKGRTS